MADLVSVCVVSYNHEKFIEYCINSIWKQEYKNIEILVLDDGSVDNSVKICNELKKNSPCPMTIISQPNSGNAGKNFNKLFKIAKGKYISIIAADDALFPDAISKKVEIMENDNSIQYVINSKIQAINGNNELIDYIPMSLDQIEKPLASNILNLEFNEIHSYYIQGALFRKTVIEAVNGFDEDMLADDIVLRTKFALYIKENPQYNFVTLHEPACYYRRHDSNISNNIIRQLTAVSMYFDKYWKNEHPSKGIMKLTALAILFKPVETFVLLMKIKYLRNVLLYLVFTYKISYNDIKKFFVY